MSDWVGIFIILISLFCGGFALGVKWGEPMLNSSKALPPAQPDVPDTTFGNMISRQAAIDAVRSYYDECDEQEESIEERIERLPSADIDLSRFSDKLWAAAYERGKAEVVRCKDCYHYDEESEMCSINNSEFEPTDYCSYGSR